MKVESKVKSVLKNEEVIVRYIRDNSKYNGKHILAGGLHKDGGKILTIRRVNGRIVPFLDQNEIEALSINLGENLSWSNDLFWKNPDFEVKLINGDLRLNLADPIDYIKWKYLQKYDLLIAPSWERREEIATYRWVFVYNSDDADSANQELDTTMQIWMQFGKIEKDVKTLSYLYNKLEGKLIDPNTKPAVIRGWFKDVISKKGTLFLKYATDTLLDERVIIFHAKRAGLITKAGEMFYYGDKKLSSDPKFGSEDAAAEFIGLIENQDIKLELMAKLNN